jgi:hypothetical protein
MTTWIPVFAFANGIPFTVGVAALGRNVGVRTLARQLALGLVARCRKILSPVPDTAALNARTKINEHRHGRP